MLCSIGLGFPHFLSIGDHLHLQRASLAGKRIVDVYRFYNYALPFKKNIEALEARDMPVQERSQARLTLVQRFFKTPEILLLDPVPLTALFDSLHPETLKDDLYLNQNSHMIKKISVHFFSSQSTAHAVEKRAKIYGDWTKNKWDAINEAPNDFFIKLSPVMINTMVFFILKAAKDPSAEQMHAFNEGCCDAISVFATWMSKPDSRPKTLRPLDDYMQQFTQKKGEDFASMLSGVVLGIYGKEDFERFIGKKSFQPKKSTPMKLDPVKSTPQAYIYRRGTCSGTAFYTNPGLIPCLL